MPPTPSHVARLTIVFKGYATPPRLAIVSLLQTGPQSVSEIACATGMVQPLVSKHLAFLRRCGLVARERRGQRTYYQLRTERVGELLQVAEALLEELETPDHVGSHGAGAP